MRKRSYLCLDKTNISKSMKKRVLILSSSPRRGGNSDSLCDEFLRGALEAGHDAEKVFLKDKRINYCTGCDTCSTYGKPCPQRDDAAEVIDKMLAADVIVMATPVYFYTMSAQMKTLIDRCCGLYTEMKNKEFYLILTAADEDREKMLRTVDTFQGFFDCLESPVLKGVVMGCGIWHMGEIKGSPALEEAYQTGRGI